MKEMDGFEVEVSRALGELATVSRGTVEEARASIADLPDRRERRVGRAGRRAPRLSFRRSPALSLVGVAAVLIAVVSISLAGKYQVAPVASASQSLAASPAVTETPAPSATATVNTDDKTPQPLPDELPVVLRGYSLNVVGWSPDGSAVAIAEQRLTDAFPLPTVHIFDRNGTEIWNIQAAQFGWLDSARFVIIRFEMTAEGNVTGNRAYFGRLGSQNLTPIPGDYDGLVAGRSGAVALTVHRDAPSASQPQYVVVTGTTTSAPRSGYPMAWSRDGAQLAVAHPLPASATASTSPIPSSPSMGARPAAQTAGWLEIVRASGESVASLRDIQTPIDGQVRFSPDGARVSFRDDTNAATTGAQTSVAEVATGRVGSIPKAGTVTWIDSNELLVVDSAGSSSTAVGNILSWKPAVGDLQTYAVGDVVTGSGRGTVVSGTSAERLGGTAAFNSYPAARAGPATSGQFASAGPIVYPIDDSAWSPDGKSLVLVCGSYLVDTETAVLVTF